MSKEAAVATLKSNLCFWRAAIRPHFVLRHRAAAAAFGAAAVDFGAAAAAFGAAPVNFGAATAKFDAALNRRSFSKARNAQSITTNGSVKRRSLP